jgi:anti-sigma factor RsiW
MKPMRPWRRRELVCREAVALITDYLDGALPRRQRDLLERHLAGCPHCSTYLEQIRTTIRALGRVDADTLPEDTQDALVALFRAYQADR